MFVGGILLLVLGYLGFISLPDKTSGYWVAVLLLCMLMLLAGALGLVGALVYGVVRAAAGDRKQPGPEENAQGLPDKPESKA
jgi:hypothetical protein